MKTVTLNGARMTSVETTHQYLAYMLHFPKYYGGNLDALWDVLSTMSEPILIRLMNKDKLIHHLGDYAKSLLNVIFEAATVNEMIHFEIL